jgi:hypothetical protein
MIQIIETYIGDDLLHRATAYRAMLGAMEQGADLSSAAYRRLGRRDLAPASLRGLAAQDRKPILDGSAPTELLHIFISTASKTPGQRHRRPLRATRLRWSTRT